MTSLEWNFAPRPCCRSLRSESGADIPMRFWRSLLAVSAVAAMASGLAAWRPLTVFNYIVPKHSAASLVESDIAYGEHLRQRLDIYRPVHAQKNIPVVVFFYGGAWDSGRRQDYTFVGQALASRGYLVVIPDYRLVPDVRFPDFLLDCASAVRWTRHNAERWGGDGNRIVLVGHSAGAYNAAMLALDSRFLGGDHKAVRGFVALAAPLDFLPLDDPASIAAFSHWPRLDETQPVNFVTRTTPPALLLHGEADERVRVRNSRRLKMLMDAAGARAELRIYPGVSHAGILLALAEVFRGMAPALDEIDRFVSEVSR